MASNQLFLVVLASFLLNNHHLISLSRAIEQKNQDNQEYQKEQSTSNGDSWQHWWSYDGISGKFNAITRVEFIPLVATLG